MSISSLCLHQMQDTLKKMQRQVGEMSAKCRYTKQEISRSEIR